MVDQHGHTAAGFLCGLTLALFAFGLSGSDARVVIQRGQKNESSMLTAELVLPLASSESSSSQEPLVFFASSQSVQSSITIPVRRPAPPVQQSLRPAAPTVVISQVEETPLNASSSSDVSSAEAVSSSVSSLPEFSSSASSVVSAVSSSAQASSSSALPAISSSSQAIQPSSEFPAFDHSSWPVGKVPNWGAMHSPAEWNRTYNQLTAADFVPIPRYDLSKLTIPMSQLTNPITAETEPIITAKLFYSTRFWGSYNLDAGENSGDHPGVDLKLARGTPIGAIGGGRVVAAETNQHLGLHVIIEHRMKDGQTFYSIYGHFDSVTVKVGQDVKPGQVVGYVGMTGNTSAPHLHLQIDKGAPSEHHEPYEGLPTTQVVNPITFLSQYHNGD